MPMTAEEWRLVPRRRIDPLPVSIAPRRPNRLVVKWHLGEIFEVSTAGARIQMIGSTCPEVGVSIELLCFPAGGLDEIEAQPTPSRLTGVVVWRDAAAAQIGVAFTP